jgi:hypothetical protein
MVDENAHELAGAKATLKRNVQPAAATGHATGVLPESSSSSTPTPLSTSRTNHSTSNHDTIHSARSNHHFTASSSSSSSSSFAAAEIMDLGGGAKFNETVDTVLDPVKLSVPFSLPLSFVLKQAQVCCTNISTHGGVIVLIID